MGFLNPNSDLEAAVKSYTWDKGTDVHQVLTVFILDLINESNNWNQDNPVGDPQVGQERFEWLELNFAERAKNDFSLIEAFNLAVRKNYGAKVPKPIVALEEMNQYAMMAAQTIMLLEMNRVLRGGGKFNEQELDILGNSNMRVYENQNRLVKTTKEPKWDNFVYAPRDIGKPSYLMSNAYQKLQLAERLLAISL